MCAYLGERATQELVELVLESGDAETVLETGNQVADLGDEGALLNLCKVLVFVFQL